MSIARPAQAAQPASDEVQIEVLDVGVGGVARPGGWIGIRLRLTDQAPTPREIMVRVTGFDPDGDRPVYEEVLAAPEGQGREVWVYLPLPYGSSTGTTLPVEVYEAIATDAPATPYDAGRLLGRSMVVPSSVAAGESGLVALVSQSRVRRDLGLGQYATRDPTGPWAPTGHELLRMVGPMAPGDLPDRWMGLMQFSTMVWYDADPSQLGTERPRAVREWVMRGGHLVIVLPPVGQAWVATRSNPLADLLPAVAIERRELSGAQLDRLGALLGIKPVQFGAGAPVVTHTLRPNPRAEPWSAVPILDDPQGQPIVVRRLVGQGMVTLIGLDLGAAALRARGLPRADQFWHRILGRRGETPGASRIQELTARGALSSSRSEVWVDSDVSRAIAKTGRSAAGLLLAFALFIVYWLLAGPVGFAVLRHKGLTRHAWVAFVAIAGVFTALSWSGAMSIRPKGVEGSHLTILDHVYEQPIERARTWISVLIPWYGDATLSLPAPDSDAGRLGADAGHNLIAVWQPRKGTTGGGGFPDARAYEVAARSPDRVRFPTRATVKQLVVDWAGAPVSGWRMPRPVLAEGQAGEPALGLTPGGLPTGRLVHELPGDLEHVVLIVNRGQRPIAYPVSIPARVRDVRITDAIAAKLDGVWSPGEVLDLDDLAAQRAAYEPLDRTLRRLVPRPSSFLNAPDDEEPRGRIEDHVLAASLFSLLPPPSFRESGRDEPLVRRWQMHGLDLSRWLTEPCVIIIGEVVDTPTPTPQRLGEGDTARAFRSSGRTFVRWVYPLPAAPPPWQERSDEPDGADSFQAPPQRGP